MLSRAGMVGREVQVVEAVQLAGDVGLLEDLKAHGAERIVQVVAHLGDGVQTAGRGAECPARRCRSPGSTSDAFIFSSSRRWLQQLGQLGLGLVHRLAHLGTQGNVQLGQLLQQSRQRALLAQQQRP